MKFENLITLIKTVSDSKLTEFRLEENGTSIYLNKTKPTASEAVFLNAADIDKIQKNVEEKSLELEDNAAEKLEGNIVRSPLVGTFYAAPSEDAEPYVAVGDTVKKGQTLAIVEAMKLMNEIENEFDGKVAEIYVQNGQAVEYGEPLFRIE